MNFYPAGQEKGVEVWGGYVPNPVLFVTLTNPLVTAATKPIALVSPHLSLRKELCWGSI